MRKLILLAALALSSSCASKGVTYFGPPLSQPPQNNEMWIKESIGGGAGDDVLYYCVPRRVANAQVPTPACFRAEKLKVSESASQ